MAAQLHSNEPCNRAENFANYARRAYMDCEGNPSCLDVAVREQIEEALKIGDCACYEQALTLGLQLRILRAEHLNDFLKTCSIESADLHFTQGTLFLEQGEPQLAVPCFEAALLSGTDPAGCHANLSRALADLGQMEAAISHLTEAWHLTSETDINHIGIIVSIGGFYLKANDPEMALEWGERYPEAVAQFKAHQPLHPGLVEHLNVLKAGNDYNELLAHAALGDSAFVAHHWSHIPWNSIPIPPNEFLSSLLQICSILESTSPLAAYKNEVDTMFSRLSLEETYSSVGVFGVLHPNVREPLFGPLEINRVWKILEHSNGLLTASEEAADSAVRVSSSQTAMSFHQFGIVFALLSLFMAGVYIVSLRRRSARLKAEPKEHFDRLFTLVDDPQSHSKEWQERLNMLQMGQQNKVAQWLHNARIELNELEWKTLSGLSFGLSPKELAQHLNLSPGHLYNTTSSLRNKLGIAEETPIKAWIDEQINTIAP